MERYSRRWIIKVGVVFAGSLAFIPLSTLHATERKEEEPTELACPIQYWHEVFDQNAFESYIYDLRKNNYFPISLSDIWLFFAKGIKNWPKDEQPIAITFDDGLLSQYTKFMNI